jgi:hypothetical protein
MLQDIAGADLAALIHRKQKARADEQKAGSAHRYGPSKGVLRGNIRIFYHGAAVAWKLCA